MNIAILIFALAGGGAERVAQVLGNYFVDSGNNVYYFLADTSLKVQDYEVKGKIVDTKIKGCLSQRDKGNNYVFQELINSANKIRKLKKEYEIDVAISFVEEYNYINILSMGREKVYVRVCTILSRRNDLNNILYDKELIKFFYSKADKVIVMSRYAQKEMQEIYKVPAKKLVTIPNPIKEKDEYSEKENAWIYGEKVILSVARLEHIKQQERIIRAFSYTVQQEIEAKLLILGKGRNKQVLESLCKKLSIENNVIFVGFTKQVDFYLKHARAFVMASKVEGFPNSMIEAMRFGLPIISIDSPGGCSDILEKENIEEIIKDIKYCPTGILTPYINNKIDIFNDSLYEEEIKLGQAMLKIIKEDDLYNLYRKKSLEKAKEYEINKIALLWDKLLRERQYRNIFSQISLKWYKLHSLFKSFFLKENNSRDNNSKFMCYFYTLDQWLTLKEKNISLEKIFLEKNYKNIAIYGIGKLGNHLVEELKGSNIEVSYFIDKSWDSRVTIKKVYGLEDDFPNVDVIVVTPTFDFENIKRVLEEKTDIRIISLDEILFSVK